MATLAEIRAKLQQKEQANSGGTGGDNALFPFWETPEGSTTTLRFLPDDDPDNTFFWRERQMIHIPFPGVEGDTDSGPIKVKVPCNEMWGPYGSCPVLSEIRPWFKDPNMEDLAKKYWKKYSFLFQGFVVDTEVQEQNSPENPIRRFIINKEIFEMIKAAILSPDFEEMPTDYEAGTDFRISKTKNGNYASYKTSSWARRERPLNDEERAAISEYGLFNLGDFIPNKPSDDELRVIQEMFEASVDGQLYDPARWGEFYRPAGMRTNTDDNKSQSSESTTKDETPPFENTNTSQPMTRDEPEDAGDPVTTDQGSTARSAQDILAAIRNR